jgi:hypothetical protein
MKCPALWGGTATLLPNNRSLIFGGKDDKGIDQNIAYLFDPGIFQKQSSRFTCDTRDIILCHILLTHYVGAGVVCM